MARPTATGWKLTSRFPTTNDFCSGAVRHRCVHTYDYFFAGSKYDSMSNDSIKNQSQPTPLFCFRQFWSMELSNSIVPDSNKYATSETNVSFKNCTSITNSEVDVRFDIIIYIGCTDFARTSDNWSPSILFKPGFIYKSSMSHDSFQVIRSELHFSSDLTTTISTRINSGSIQCIPMRTHSSFVFKPFVICARTENKHLIWLPRS